MTVGHLALSLLALGAAGCGARGAAEAPASPGLQPWEVRYDTEATIDPASGDVHATTRLLLGSEGGSEGGIGLLLNRGLEVRSVDGPAVRSYRVGTSDFAPTWNLIEIDLDLATGEAIAIDLAYGGVLDMGGSVGGITATSIELSAENMWHPLLATFDREMVGALRVRLPDGWTVVSSGAARVVEEMHALDMRIPQLDVPLSAAPAHARRRRPARTTFTAAAFSARGRERSFYQGLGGPWLRSALQGGIAYPGGLGLGGPAQKSNGCSPLFPVRVRCVGPVIANNSLDSTLADPDPPQLAVASAASSLAGSYRSPLRHPYALPR
jgi:hypothetical protein